jgi:predicted adenylyl cyclase CyaB
MRYKNDRKEKKRDLLYRQCEIHIDEVPALGSFIEIEAGNIFADKTESELLDQCNFYLKEFGIKEEDLIAESYSDLLMKVNDTI